jgi:C_GCAxxG_C_C family probable redox protein
MDDVIQRAREIFTKCNCSQAVLTAYGPSLGVDPSICMSAAACFGAGMGRLGKTCGALTGGLIVLGLRHGKEMQDDPQRGRDTVYARVQKLVSQFEAKHGSSECRALTNCDMTTPEGRSSFSERGLHQGLCTELVVSVVEMLKEE